MAIAVAPWWMEGCPPTGGGRPALLDGHGLVVSWDDLQRLVQRTSLHLAQLGVDRGERLALAMAPGPPLAIGLLGAMGVASVAPLVPGNPLEVMLADLQRLRVTRVLVDQAPPPALVEAARQLGLPLIALDPLSDHDHDPEPDSDPGSGAAAVAVPPVASQDLALLLQTSGTTSRPKVVPLSHGNLRASARAVAAVLALGPDDRSLAAMPLFHIHGIVASLLAPLLAGGSVICCRSSDPSALLALLASHQPTWLSAVPTLLQALLSASERQQPAGAAHRLRLLRSSSSPLAPALQQRLQAHFGVPVLEAYGMTEAAHQICSNRLPPDGPELRPGSVGTAAGPELVVLGPDRVPLPAGVSGEVAIRGPGVTAGYEAAEHDGWITASDGSRWFPTGDEGVLDAEGRLVLTGRLKEMINRGGEKVIPRRVDEAFLQHPAVDQALAFALPHPTLGEDLAVAVVLRDGALPDEPELRRHALAALAPHELPSRIVFLEALPRGATGKLQRIGLAERLADALRPAEAAAVSELEQIIAGVIAEVLEQSPPALDANFFELGGDSLSGSRVISRLSSLLGLDLPPTLLFTAATVRSLAEQLDQRLDAALAQLEERP
jgi:acyl-CoA synthetase (AMP-forming)/AMP-acid ligase II/acyl carrier protein